MLPPGQMIGTRYQVESLLGQGGMSFLYLARDNKHQGMTVVIKEMSASFPDPKEQKQANDLFMREAQLLTDLNHPHIPKVFDKFTFQGKYYLAMEYVEGEDLGKKLTRHPAGMPERQVAEWGAQMATVLYYLHMHKPPIVFRDVKPSNMMIDTKTQTVKLIDFGIARFKDPNKKGDTMRIGSPGYAPPEQYSGQTDPRSDVYALGVTLHHALTGRDPTVTQTPFILPPARELNPQISQAMAALVEKATQLDPDKRYANMIEMKRDLQGVLRSHGVIASQTSPNMGLPAPRPGAVSPIPQGAPIPATPTPASTPAPTPTPAAVTPPPKKKGSWLPVLVLIGCLAGSVATAALAPGVVDDGRRALAVLFYRLFHKPLPHDPGLAGVVLYKDGAPLGTALDLLALGRKKNPAEPAVAIAWNNALALSGTTRKLHIAVVAPEAKDSLYKGVALAQSALNQVGGVDQSLLVVDLETYAEGKLKNALFTALSGRSGRVEGKLEPPEALVVFADQAPDTPIPTVCVSDRELQPSAANTVVLPQVSAEPGPLLAAALPAEASNCLWLLKDKPPEKGKINFKVVPAPTDRAGAVLLAKGGWVVADAQQAKLFLDKPDAGLHLLIWASQLSEAGTVDKLYNGDKGPTLVAVTGPSQLSAEAPAASFWRDYPIQFGADSSPDPGAARAYDALWWCALRARQPSASYAGATVFVDADGKAKSCSHSRWTGSAHGWLYNRDLQEATP